MKGKNRIFMPVVFVSVEAWDLGYAMWKAHAQPAK